MRVLVLAWPVEGRELSSLDAGVAASLAVAHTVRVVTRLPRDGIAPTVDAVEVHAVADPPPIVPVPLADPVLDALAVAGRATAVAVRRLEETPVDVVLAMGWQAGPVARALRHSHDVPVVAALEPFERRAAGPQGELASELAATADVIVQRSPRAVDEGARRVPVGVALPSRRPGPPPGRGPVHLTVAPTATHHVVASALRTRLMTPRRISRSIRRRPAAAVVLDPQALDAVVQAWARGVPVVAVAGPVGDLVTEAGAGVVVDPDPAAVARAVDDLLADTARGVELGASARRAARGHTWEAVTTAWTDAATDAASAHGEPRLHAAG